MELNIEVVPSLRGEWVWRVRSSDDRNGSTCLALGLAKTDWQAQKKAMAVRDALAPIFKVEYRSEP